MFAAANVGIEIGKAYYDPYAALYTGDRPSRFEDPWTAGVSISVIDCAALENLASVTKQTLSSDPILLNLLLNSNIYNYDRRAKSSSSYIGYYDMRQLMQYLSSDIDNWTSAANNAIIYWKVPYIAGADLWCVSLYSFFLRFSGCCRISFYSLVYGCRS